MPLVGRILLGLWVAWLGSLLCRCKRGGGGGGGRGKATNLTLEKKVFYYNEETFGSAMVVGRFVWPAFSASLAVDLGAFHFVENVNLVAETGSELEVVVYENLLRDVVRLCFEIPTERTPGRQEFVCNRACRFVVLAAKTQSTVTLTSLDIQGQELHVEKFMGCFSFRSPNASKIQEANNFTESLDSCRREGSASFVAIMEKEDGVKFVCAKTLVDLISQNLDKCPSLCSGRFLCGRQDYYAVYRTAIAEREWISDSCASRRGSCDSDCPKGYEGTFCKFRVCRVNNGHCGGNLCQSLKTSVFTYTACRCKNSTVCPDVCASLGPCKDEPYTTCILQGVNHVCACKNGRDRMDCGDSVGTSTARATDKTESTFECQEENRCNKETTACRASLGSHYYCHCLPGFKKEASRYSCEDIDECASPDICVAPEKSCHNVEGTYECWCPLGFVDVNGLCEGALKE